MNIYRYERVRIRVRGGFLESRLEEDYFEVITRYAAAGWRFVQAFAPGLGGHGAAVYVELIFEREAQSPSPSEPITK